MYISLSPVEKKKRELAHGRIVETAEACSGAKGAEMAPLLLHVPKQYGPTDVRHLRSSRYNFFNI